MTEVEDFLERHLEDISQVMLRLEFELALKRRKEQWKSRLARQRRRDDDE